MHHQQTSMKQTVYDYTQYVHICVYVCTVCCESGEVLVCVVLFDHLYSLH